MSERSARHLFERFDTGPIAAALDARLPSRTAGSSLTTRGSLLEDTPVTAAMGSQLRSAAQQLGRGLTPRSTDLGSAYSPVRQVRQEAKPRTVLSTGGDPFQSSPRGTAVATWGSGAMRSNTSDPYSRGVLRNSDTVQQQVNVLRSLPPVQQPGQGDPGGMGNPTGGNWDKVNQWNSLIASAIQRVASETGVTVPANVIKAVMELESGGVNVGCNFAGYCGLMQTGPGSNISNFNAAYNATPEGNIYYGAQELANWYRAIGTGDWVDAAAAYFSGYNYNRPNVSDGYGTTVAQYRARIESNLATLNSAGGGGWSGGGGSGGLNTSFGNYWAQNQHDFGVTSGNGLYGYGTQYGLNGVQHTGEDVMMPLGTTFYAPADATVVCAGCWRNDHITGGVGRIELEMPDGARILYDHSNQSFVQVGQRVRAGQPLGTSGGMYSPHIHLEVRVRDANTSSGWRLVDPSAYFAGYVGGGSTGGGQIQRQFVSSHDRIRQILGRI